MQFCAACYGDHHVESFDQNVSERLLIQFSGHSETEAIVHDGFTVKWTALYLWSVGGYPEKTHTGTGRTC